MPLRLSGSTGVSGIDGTAQAPAVQGTNPNAGIYYSGNNVIVSTSGNTALTVGPSGNVAISNSFSISGQYVSAYSGMMKNRIINGDFKIDQRFAGAANNNPGGSSQYVVDRWRINGSSASKLRFQQNNTNGPGSSATQNATGFPNYFGANVVSSNTVNAGDFWLLGQDVEGLNIADLGWGTANASSVTLSFWSYSSIAGNHGGSLRNSNSNRSYPFTYNIGAANTWQYQIVTIPGDTTGSWFSNNNIGVTVFFSVGTGSNYSSTANNTWQQGNYLSSSGTVNTVSSANGALYLTGVQLEKGSQATPFEFRHYTTELQLCQRYYYRRNSSSTNDLVSTLQAYQSTGIWGKILDLPVVMRSSPVVNYSSIGHFSLSGATSTQSICTSNNGFDGSPYAIWSYNGILSSTASLTAGIASVFSFNTTSGWIAASAELAVQN